MSADNIQRLREMQQRIETDAASANSFYDLRRLRAYWGDIERIIQSEQLDNSDEQA